MLEIACRGFIVWSKRLLLCRQNNPTRTFWVLPGGGLKEGESLENCIIREVFEEINLKVKVTQLLFIRELLESTRHRIEFYFSIRTLVNDFALDLIQPKNEISEIKFFSLEELRSSNAKPDCLPQLLEDVINKQQIQFPIFLGTVK